MKGLIIRPNVKQNGTDLEEDEDDQNQSDTVVVQ